MSTTLDHTTSTLEPPDPDDGGWNPAWFHPLLAAIWLGVMAAITVATELAPWWWVPTGIVLTVVARKVMQVWVTEDTHGDVHLQQASRLVVAAGVTATGWLVYAGHAIASRPGPPIGLLVVWTVTFGLVYAVLRRRAPVRAEKVREDKAQELMEEERTAELIKMSGLWNPWLAQAQCTGVGVIDVTPTRAGYTLHLGVGPDQRGQVTRFGTLLNAIDTLAMLASRHYHAEGIPISEHQIRPEQTDTAHLWLLHVDTEQPLKKTIPAPGDQGVGDIREPFDVGIYSDGAPIEVTLYGTHGTMVSGTGGGKTVVANNLIRGVTRCDNAMLAVAGTSKLMPLVWPWLEPWLRGETRRPVIDIIAGDSLQEVLLFLAYLYRLGMERNARLGPVGPKHVPTRDDPAIYAIIDEATHLAENKTAVVNTYDGRTWTASHLIKTLAEMLRSAGGGLFFFTQYGLIDALGDHGTNTMRNVSLRIAGRTEKVHDGTVTITGVPKINTTTLRDNMIYVQPNNEIPRAIQAKAYKLEDREQIHDLAIAHTRYRPNELPAWLVNKLGPAYTERWLPDRQPALVAACEHIGIPYPIAGATSSDTRDEIDDTVNTGQTDQPRQDTSQPLTSDDTPGTLQAVTTAPSIDDMRHLSSRIGDTLAEIREYGPFGKIFARVRGAFLHEQAPDQATAGQLAYAAKLVDPDTDPDSPEFAQAVAELVEDMRFHGIIPTQRTSDDPRPVFTKAAILDGWDRRIAEYKAATGQQMVEQDSVLSAVQGMADSDWVLVGVLGREAGHITDTGGDEVAAREQARRFGTYLRGHYNLTDDAFKRINAGTAVNVGALRSSRAVITG